MGTTPQTIAAGIIIAGFTFFLLWGGIKILRQDEFRWIGNFDKAVGFLLIFVSLALMFIIVFGQ